MRNQHKKYRKPKTVFDNNADYAKPNTFDQEGVDHINISIGSKSKIGLLLTPEYIKVIDYPHLGKFTSVMSLWYWIRSHDKDDRIRRMVGHKLKIYAQQNKLYKNYIPNFKAIIAYATWLKVKKYKSIMDEIAALDPDIKILSYYMVDVGGVRVTTNYAEFITQVGSEIIKAIKEKREPDFDFLCDRPDEKDMYYVSPVLELIGKKP